MQDQDTQVSVHETAVQEYESLREHMLCGAPVDRPGGLVVLLRHGLAAWRTRRPRIVATTPPRCVRLHLASSTTTGTPQFVSAPRLTDEDVERIVETTARRVVRLCERRGLLEEGAVDPYWEQEPLLAQLSAASVQGVVATGEHAGRRVRRQLSDPQDGVRSGALCYPSRGFSQALLAAPTPPPARRRPTGAGWSGCAATSYARRWLRVGCASSTTRRWCSS